MSVPTTNFAASGYASSIASAKSVPLPTDVSPTMKPPTRPIEIATIRSRGVSRPRRTHRPALVQERLGDERDRADEQREAEHPALHRVDAVPVAVGQVGRQPDSHKRGGRAPHQHPGAQARLHRPQAAMPDCAERLEDGAVQDVRTDGRRRVEVEEEDEDRRHQRAAPHARHPDEQAGDEPRGDESRVVHGFSGPRGRRRPRDEARSGPRFLPPGARRSPSSACRRRSGRRPAPRPVRRSPRRAGLRAARAPP